MCLTYLTSSCLQAAFQSLTFCPDPLIFVGQGIEAIEETLEATLRSVDGHGVVQRENLQYSHEAGLRKREDGEIDDDEEEEEEDDDETDGSQGL